MHISILHKFIRKIEEEKILPNSKASTSQASITLLSKPDKNITKHYFRRKLYTHILVNIDTKSFTKH